MLRGPLWASSVYHASPLREGGNRDEPMANKVPCFCTRHHDVRWRGVDPRRDAGGLASPQSRLLANHHRHIRRSTMAPSRTRVMGMEVHQDSLAVAYVAQ